jgi:hypothetical protein
MSWESQHLQTSQTEQAIGQFASRAMGNQFPNINQDVVKTFNLYRFFVQHINTPAATLQPLITENGTPIFTVADIEEIQAKIRKQTNNTYVKYLSQRGGTTSVIPVTPVSDPSREKFWDKLIARITYPIWSNIPPSWNGLLWYVFILNSLENVEIIGPFISTALDVITLTLPNIPSLIDSILPKLFALLPFPYMSTAGDVISYAIGLIFILLSVFMNIQRKHFGSAFKASLEIMPIIGDSVAEMAQSVETGAERYQQNRAKMLSKIEMVTPSLENYLDYYTPSTDIKTGPAPQFSIPQIKQDLVLYAQKEAGLNSFNITNPANMLSSAINSGIAKATNAATASVSKATNAVASSVSKATNAATASVSKATNAAASSVSKATNAATASVSKATNATASSKKTRKHGGQYKKRKTIRIRG